ncbi:MAG: AAA family ATPase [Bacteroidales bacterium]
MCDQKIEPLWRNSKQPGCGENIKAVFGIPEPLNEAPAKAVGAAIDLIERFKTFNEVKELPNPVYLRVGLETGPVIVSKVGKDEHSRFNVFGETVNTALHIRDFAEKGQIIAGPNLHSKLKGQIEFFPLEPVPVKGQKEPLQVFEFIRKKKKEFKSETSTGRMITSEMVGRQTEFELLQNGVFNLINGKGSIINITGKAGIGKSRLFAELRQKELMKKVALFEGRAVSNGQNLSFHPIIQIIKSWAGIREEDTSENSVEKLQKNILRVYPEAFDEIFPFIATMMGYRLDGKAKERTKGIEGEALENLILKNLRDLLSRAASIRPVLIVIEDAHWCDFSSIIFLESLLKLVRKQRIMFVLIFRPDYKETGERISKYIDENLKDHHQSLQINPLSTDQSNKLINNLLHEISLPEEINRLIIERAAGNPFFIEEVIRSFLDEGLIEINNNQFILTENIKYANIPESIDNVILSRIDRLDDKTKNLLRTASVIGRNFYYKVLEEAAQTIEEMDIKLEYLKDVQLINERKTKDEVEFLFKHALAQQATYESIVEKTKKELHLKIAGSIEKVFAGRIHEFYGMLAHHYSKAGQTGKAEEYLVKAGDESMKSGASSEAVNFFIGGLEAYLLNNKNSLNLQKIIDLEERLAFAYFASGQFTEAIEYFDKVTTWYHRPFAKSGISLIIDFVYNLVLLYKIIWFYKKQGIKSEDTDIKLLKIAELKGHALTTIDPKRLFFESMAATKFIKKETFGSYQASVLLINATMFFYTGLFFNLGIKSSEFALKFIDKTDIHEWLRIVFNRSMYIYYDGKGNEDLNEEKVYQLAHQTGDFWKVATYYVYQGYNAIEAGNEQLVTHLLNRLKTISETFDSDFPIIQYHRVRTALYIKFRMMDELMTVTDEALKFAKNTQYKMQLFLSYCYNSMACTIRSKPAESRDFLAQAEKLLKYFKIPFCRCQYLIAKSYLEIYGLKTGKIDIGIGNSALRTTKDLIHDSQKVRKNLPEAYRLRAIIFSLLGKPNKALRNFDKSIKAALSFNGNLEISRTYFEAGKFLRDPKNKKERINGMNSTECLMKAKAMFEEMDLQWDLREYQHYMENKE